MMTHNKYTFKVSFNYSVFFTRNIFIHENSTLCDAVKTSEQNRKHKLMFLVEKKVADSFPNLATQINSYCEFNNKLIEQIADPIIISGGETLKSFDVISDICKHLDQNRLCRQSYAVIIGGGAFIDAVSFAASITHRGVRQIRIPTTILSQNDSGVGVKNGVNMFGKKNFIGTFFPPTAVINDSTFFNSLEYRDWISGISEAYKVAIIKDSSFFKWLIANTDKLKNRDIATMEHLVKRCAELHAEHISTSGDPFEFGSARPLDFGHWAAHKLEMLSGNSIRHGEAVAIGIILDSFYATKQGLLSEKNFDSIVSAFTELGFELWNDAIDIKNSDGQLEIFDGIDEFKEHLGGELHITLPNKIGNKIEIHEIDKKTVLDGIKFLGSFRKR